MTATTDITAIESAHGVLAKARELAEEAQDEATKANSTLTGLEQAAGRGDVVDAQTLVIARAEWEIKSSRYRTLETEATAAEDTLTQVEAEATRETLFAEFDVIDRKRVAVQRKLDTAKKTLEAAEAELKEINAGAHQRLLSMGLPQVNVLGDEDGELCVLSQRRGFTPKLTYMDVSHAFRVNGKVYDRNGRNTPHIGNRA